ncbi:Zn-dependent aminopeptidase [Nonlabens tegetincola]|uniref:Zn-dependent aminopeptidase n=1 Tax=Nonlabens tegetincola TaxID=323273 RepID=A0A090Q1G9_9FLAO|nr:MULTISPECIES: M1 family metallopeptidase [Nonlabens]GAK95558.1 Zn-dependent aminopeptidase [Nonlabens tegetincola]
MKTIKFLFFSLLMISFGLQAQETEQQEEPKAEEHYNINKFRQLYQEFSTPNQYRSASGAPGPAYYQQRADYKMDIKLDDANHHIYGYETITYTNNSPDALDYLWVQLDQNVRQKDTKSALIEGGGVNPFMRPSDFASQYMKEPFDGGFNIKKVLDSKGNALPYMINQTMMRVELPKTLKTGEKFSFDIEWDYNINNHVDGRGRSGYEQFPDGHRAYVIAQFYPRMCVYNDVEGWQNSQFWGRDEFALPFGTFEVNLTVPEDHWVDATGKLENRKDVYSKTELKRYEQATKSYDKPVIIRTQPEAEKLAMMPGATKTKTWEFKADYVRDFGWTSSRRYVADAMAVKVGDKDVMAVSIYPPEGNPLWEQWSTYAVAQTLKSYSRMTFDYPYHKAISVHAKNQGMEYPMICWNYGRPDAEGNYTDRTKFGMISVIIHEVGHNFFPMIVNSDERQWTWMDEGLNTFVQYVAEQDFGENYPAAIEGLDAYPSRRGPAAKIVPYMAGDQRYIAPIMSKGLNTYQFGSNAYSKPATGLNILRETVMGRDLFDYAFRTYSQRWMFKHPTPEDFFRSMEDASAMDLDWFWRGWFYTTRFNDMGLKEVSKYYVSNEMNQAMKDYAKENGIPVERIKEAGLVYMVKEDSEDFDAALKGKQPGEVVSGIDDYLKENFTAEERARMKAPKYFYEITVEKPGGLVMPIIIEYTFADGTKERVTHPAEIWRYNDKEVGLSKASDKEIVGITIDPDLETADIDVSNNSWPQQPKVDKFEEMRKQ